MRVTVPTKKQGVRQRKDLGTRRLVTDGPFAETKELRGGTGPDARTHQREVGSNA